MRDKLRSVKDLDFEKVCSGAKTPSPSAWEDEVLYFLLVDRFSDSNEDISTPMLTEQDYDNAIKTDEDARKWCEAGRTWVGGNLKGITSKLEYLKEMGVTALWISPVLKQANTQDGTSNHYHGYAAQNFLEVDPHFGTLDDLRDLISKAHKYNIKIILDIVLNHTGDVFAYKEDRPWDGRTHEVAGWRDGHGNVIPFTPEAAKSSYPDGAVWPEELQNGAAFTRQGRIVNWDNSPEYIEGDFFCLKDIDQGSGSVDQFVASPALITLTQVYCYWIALLDLDGLRIDTVKHLDLGAMRYFASNVHEFAQMIGKDRFFMVGEIAGSRQQALNTMELTGLDAALGIADIQYQLESTVKGWGNPAGYFDLFRNSAELGKESHTWLRNTVVVSYDNHDQIWKGENKERFCAHDNGDKLALAALFINVTTLGIPCIYYGSEQGLDGSGSKDYADSYIREAMFGGEFGPFRSRHRHVFNTEHRIYKELSRILKIRRQYLALRRGRQYLRQVSGDGQAFDFPKKLSDNRLNSIIAWSRLLAGKEVVCAINNDPLNIQTAWVTIDHNLNKPGSVLNCIYSSNRLDHRDLTVVDKNGRSVQITLHPGEVGIWTKSSL